MTYESVTFQFPALRAACLRRVSLASITMLCLAINSPPACDAAVFQGSFKGHDYYYTTAPSSLAAARAEAVSLGLSLGRKAYLAAVTTREEREFLFCLVPTTGYWIGLKRLAGNPRDEYRWAWDSGEPYVYDVTLWCSGEPSNQSNVEDTGMFPWFGPCVNDVWDGPSGSLMAIIEVESNE